MSTKTDQNSNTFYRKRHVTIYIVDKKGFREMVETLNPRYQLPHKDYFSRVAIPSLYEETREQLCKGMREECINFSATADLWSSCTSEPYLCLTVHYISSDCILKSHCLQTHFTPKRPYWSTPSGCHEHNSPGMKIRRS